MSSAGLCQARNSLPCVMPTGLSFISQSRWASVFNESHAQIMGWVLTLSRFLILQSRSEIKNGTILRLAISPVSALCLLLFYSVCVTVAPGSICGLPLESIPGFYMPVTNFVSCNFFKTRSSLLDRRARLWKGWKLLIFHGWYQHPALWMIMYDNIFC